MTGQELRRIRNSLGLTQAAFAERIGVTTNTMARWERGEMAIREAMARLVRLLAEAGPVKKPKRGGR